jgi:hypothetical protein
MLVNVNILHFFPPSMKFVAYCKKILTFVFKEQPPENDKCYNPESRTVPRNVPGVDNADVVCGALSQWRQRRLSSEFCTQHQG